jgi:hypothetical protein
MELPEKIKEHLENTLKGIRVPEGAQIEREFHLAVINWVFGPYRSMNFHNARIRLLEARKANLQVSSELWEHWVESGYLKKLDFGQNEHTQHWQRESFGLIPLSLPESL